MHINLFGICVSVTHCNPSDAAVQTQLTRLSKAIPFLLGNLACQSPKQQQVGPKEMASNCTRGGSDWLFGKISSPERLLSVGTGCPGK